MYAKILQNLAKENDFLLASAVDVLKTYFATKTCAKKVWWQQTSKFPFRRQNLRICTGKKKRFFG